MFKGEATNFKDFESYLGDIIILQEGKGTFDLTNQKEEKISLQQGVICELSFRVYEHLKNVSVERDNVFLM